MPIKFDLSKFNYNNYFIETGTYIGEGVQKAIDSNFENIISIEFDKKRYENCKELFKEYQNVKIIYGNSGIVLSNILKEINEPITFFLDAHYCSDGAEIADKWCPLKEELNAIQNHKINDHTILIDDWRCMDNTHIDYSVSEKGIEVGFPGKNKCIDKLKEINKNYQITFLDGVIEKDVVCCKL